MNPISSPCRIVKFNGFSIYRQDLLFGLLVTSEDAAKYVILYIMILKMYKSALGSIATLLILLVCSSISFGQLDYEDNSDLILNDEFSNYTLGFTDLSF